MVETFILETLMWFAQCGGPESDKVLADFKTALGQANARVLTEGAQAAVSFPELGGTRRLAGPCFREV